MHLVQNHMMCHLRDHRFCSVGPARCLTCHHLSHCWDQVGHALGVRNVKELLRTPGDGATKMTRIFETWEEQQPIQNDLLCVHEELQLITAASRIRAFLHEGQWVHLFMFKSIATRVLECQRQHRQTFQIRHCCLFQCNVYLRPFEVLTEFHLLAK